MATCRISPVVGELLRLVAFNHVHVFSSPYNVIVADPYPPYPSLIHPFSLFLILLPSWFLKVVTNHILQYMPEEIGQFGPVRSTWKFAYERFNSWLCRRALKRRHPEATILRTYQVMISSFHAVNKFSVSYTIFSFLIIQP